MNDKYLLRYSKQIMLPQIDISGQKKLQQTTMLLIGIGGLGAISSYYLATSGVGHLILVDFDKIELSNLQRQIIFSTEDIGSYKVDVAKRELLKINPYIKITTIKDVSNLAILVQNTDIVLDGTDNFNSRFIINKLCVNYKKPLISAAVIRFAGQVATFMGYKKNHSCYQCLYAIEHHVDENCSNNGILAPVAGVLGSIQATQALKVALNIGEQLVDKLLLVDMFSLDFRTIKLKKDKKCHICNDKI